MDVVSFAKYYNCIDSLQAREMANDFSISMYPHLKDTRRKDIFQKVRRRFDSVIQKSTQLADFGSTVDKLRGIFRGQ